MLRKVLEDMFVARSRWATLSGSYRKYYAGR